jgi:phage terminase large subunit-like protein
VTTCATCGKSFQQSAGKGRPRRHCLECSPHRWPEKPKAKKKGIVKGEPFTLEHFRAWSERLKLSNGKHFQLEDYEARFVADVFAGYKECWLLIPEGNGKTTLISLVGLYHIAYRPEAWVPVAAAARDQAVDLIYRVASGFVLRNPHLTAQYRCHPGLRKIDFPAHRSSLKIFAADASTGDGVIPTLMIIEEPHRHKSLDLYMTWAGKLDKEPDAQLLAVSTAGEPGGDFEALREQFRQTATKLEREGCFVRAESPTSVLHEYAIPEDGDPEDLELVKAANPFSAITLATLEAKRSRPSWNLAHWRRFTCNLPTRGDDAAITEAEWFAQQTNERIPAGESVWVGLDIGWKYDTTAAVPLWDRDPHFRLFGPARVIEPPRDGNQMHPDEVKRVLIEIKERNPIHTVVMDMSNGSDIAAWIEDELGAQVVDRQQHNSLAVLDYQRFTEALRQGWLWHSGDAVLSRHVLNAVARVLPQGEIRFDHPRKSRLTRPIDALQAAAMVHTATSTPCEAFVLV